MHKAPSFQVWGELDVRSLTSIYKEIVSAIKTCHQAFNKLFNKLALDRRAKLDL